MRFQKLGILSIILLLSCAALADPSDKTVRFSGSSLTQGTPQKLSVKALEADFKLQTIEVYNPWEKRKDKYTGIFVSDLIKQYAPLAKTVKITAIDDYQVTLMPDDWQQLRVLLATQVNGQYIDVQNKGPMRVIFPDYNAADKTYESSLPKWLWMIKHIEFN